MTSKEILNEHHDDEEGIVDESVEEMDMEEELDDGISENVEPELDVAEVEEAKKPRCQRRKKRKCVSEGDVKPEHGNEDKQEDENEQENLEEENLEEEEDEDSEEEEESLSEYDSIFSIIPFEWENEYYEFIDLCNPGTMDNIYDREEVQISYDIHGKMIYLKECNELRIPHIIRFYNALNTNQADLTFHGINNKQMKAICASLEMNQSVEALILNGNPLTSVSCNFLSILLSRNNTITRLDLNGCRIGPEGAALLASGIKDNEAVKELNLSKCYIEDEGIKYLVRPLKENYFIEKLVLSYNRLGVEAGEALAAILYSNNSIHYLDLDNNNMFDCASMKKFCRGLGFNSAVKFISLRWNAMSAVDIGDALSQFLRRNKTVNCLDLSDNRLDGQSVRALKKGIAGSSSIEILRLSRNPITSEDVEYILPAIKNCPSLKLLDLQDIWVRREFMQSLKKVQASRDLEVIVGGVYSDYIIRGPDYPALILKRAQFEAMKPKKRSAKRDLGHFVLTLGDEPLTTDQFMTLISKFNAKINKELLPELMKQFAIPKTNTIDVVAMREKYLSLFPDSKPPEQKKQAKGDGEKVNTDSEPPEQKKQAKEDEEKVNTNVEEKVTTDSKPPDQKKQAKGDEEKVNTNVESDTRENEEKIVES